MKLCDKTCVFFFFPIINRYFLMAKRSLLSRCPSYQYAELVFSLLAFSSHLRGLNLWQLTCWRCKFSRTLRSVVGRIVPCILNALRYFEARRTSRPRAQRNVSEDTLFFLWRRMAQIILSNTDSLTNGWQEAGDNCILRRLIYYVSPLHQLLSGW